MTVLSLFDGVSCGMVALERVGVKVDKYYASEIDKHSEAISKHNYPEIIRMGDVTKWKEWDIEKPDIIFAGFPCQSFSLAGKRLNFDDPRGQLFFVLCDILRHYKPKFFFLENVRMDSQIEKAINIELGSIYPEAVNQQSMFDDGELEPMLINSALVSAQNRQRNYWFNWICAKPKDKGILLKDVLENGVSYNDKSHCLTARYGGASFEHDYPKKQKQMVAVPLCAAMRGRGDKGNTKQQFESVIIQRGRGNNKGGVKKEKCPSLTANGSFQDNNHVAEPVRIGNINGSNSQENRVYSVQGKSVCLSACGDGLGAKTGLYKIDLPDGDYFIRKLTPIECEKLQTLDDDYTKFGVYDDGKTKEVANTNRYKAIGNGWTVDVIAHILSCNKELK